LGEKKAVNLDTDVTRVGGGENRKLGRRVPAARYQSTTKRLGSRKNQGDRNSGEKGE